MVCGVNSETYGDISNVYTQELFNYMLIKLTSFLASSPLLILCGYFAITDAAFLYKKGGGGKVIENPANTFFLN